MERWSGEGRETSEKLERLRIAELVIFGLPAAFFLMLQHRVTIDDAFRNVMPPPLPFWLLLIFTYGMFIPNTWRRAAFVIGAMALAPALLLAGTMLAFQEVALRINVFGATQFISVLLIAAVASVFGTRLINTLRHEVFEAKQLGQYRLVKLLGAGGMGAVYLAEHRMLKRPCAIKLIHPDRAGDARTARVARPRHDPSAAVWSTRRRNDLHGHDRQLVPFDGRRCAPNPVSVFLSRPWPRSRLCAAKE